MNYNQAKVDELTLALMYLTSFTDGDSMRSWKGYDWETLARLHAAGFISNPAKKAKSVGLSEQGAKRAEELFQKHFAR
jgi:hypothetical protein